MRSTQRSMCSMKKKMASIHFSSRFVSILRHLLNNTFNTERVVSRDNNKITPSTELIMLETGVFSAKQSSFCEEENLQHLNKFERERLQFYA